MTKLLTSFLTCVLLLVAFASVNAQEKPPLKREIEEEQETINTGWVIAFGEKIVPPYEITLENEKIFINGIVFSPREEAPNKQKEEVVTTKLDIQKHELIKSCENSYIAYYNSEGEQKAREKVLEEYSKHQLISSMEFQNDILTMQFADSSKENIMLNSLILSKPTEEEIREQKEKEIDKIKSFLQERWMIAFGYEYTMYIPYKNAEKIDEIISDIKNEKSSLEKGKEQIMELIRRKETFINDIINNINTWE